MSAAIVAFGAVSGLGSGEDAVDAGDVGAPPRVAISVDPELVSAGLRRPFAARVARAPAPEGEPSEDPATRLLAAALEQCAGALDRARPGWRRGRVGLALGTSSGGLASAVRFYDAVAERQDPPPRWGEEATYYGPMHRAARRLGLAFEPATLILGACASATLAIGVAARWLAAGSCDLALAGGFDALTVFVAAGFEALRATSSSPSPRPFRAGRDGMALGEGAAVLALARPEDAAGARVFVRGFGASADAVHLTAPDRTGTGLARAALAALADAGLTPEDIALVSAHATATPFNDAAEAKAIAAAAPPSAVVHPFKAQVGHTLGAAGALETLCAALAMTRGILPAAAGEGALDPAAAVRLLTRAERGEVRAALKLSSAFGGANAVLCLAREPRAIRPPRPVFVSRAVGVRSPDGAAALAARRRDLAPEALATAVDRIARADRLTHLILTAVARLEDAVGSLAGAGVVVGHHYATTETNAAFQARLRARGAGAAEPRRFPYTSPNAGAGDASLVFHLTGPSFAVGGGPHAGVEALAIAAGLVGAGDADRVVVVAVDEVGDLVRRASASGGDEAEEGAVATLVSCAPLAGGARVGAVILRLDAEASPPVDPAPRGASGHGALRPLVDGEPAALEARGRGVFGRVELWFRESPEPPERR